MKSRLIAAVTAAALVLVGTTGCTFITPQRTTQEYSASDGVNVADTGPVVVRNAMIIANAEGTAGNLVVALANTSTQPQTMTIHVTGAEPVEVELAAGQLISFGSWNTRPILLTGFSGKPGANATATFQSGTELPGSAHVPVLDGTLPEYSHLVPGGTRASS